MKKLFITLALVAAAAFSANAQLRVEVLGNLADYNFTGTLTTQTTDPQFSVGARALYTVFQETETAGLELGLGYMMNKASNTTTNSVLTVHNLQLPVHVYYGLDLGTVQIIPYVGFYAGYAVGGSAVVSAGPASVTNNPFEGNTGMKKFDFGTDDEIVVGFGRFSLGIGTQVSFLNLCKDTSVKIKYNTLYFSLGIKF